jgi:hypothetical protein
MKDDMKKDKRKARIIELMRRLEEGEEVSRNSLARVLTPELMVGLGKSWEAEKESRKLSKPPELKKYERMLRAGVLLYGRYEATHQKMTAYKSKEMIEGAQSKMEKALEFAVELVQINSSFRMWFDREPKDADFGAPVSMPRVVTSKSCDNQSHCKCVPFANSKRDLKLAALYAALEELEPSSFEAFVKPTYVLRNSRSWQQSLDLSGWNF